MYRNLQVLVDDEALNRMVAGRVQGSMGRTDHAGVLIFRAHRKTARRQKPVAKALNTDYGRTTVYDSGDKRIALNIRGDDPRPVADIIRSEAERIIRFLDGCRNCGYEW